MKNEERMMNQSRGFDEERREDDESKQSMCYVMESIALSACR